MIEQQHSKYLMVCDICLEEYAEYDSWEKAVEFKHEFGFKSRFDKDDKCWLDICPKCWAIDREGRR